MAIRRYKLAIDNHPAAGYATIDDIQGSGEFFMELGWEPQAATVSLAKQYMTPPEYVPTKEAVLHILLQDGATPSGQAYNIIEASAAATPMTVSALQYTSIYTFDFISSSFFINPNSWTLFSNISIDMADQVVFSTRDFIVSTPVMLMLVDRYHTIQAKPLYAGFGIDASASFGLPPLTKFEIMGGITELTEVAEMVFIDGIQLEGDIYDYDYYYGTGAYDMTVENNILYIQFNTPVDPFQLAFFIIFARAAQPELRVRYENNPFEENGMWLVYNNLPKGILRFNYYVR